MSPGLPATSNAVSRILSFLAGAGWIPLFDPVSAKRCSPLCRQLRIIRIVYSYAIRDSSETRSPLFKKRRTGHPDIHLRWEGCGAPKFTAPERL